MKYTYFIAIAFVVIALIYLSFSAYRRTNEKDGQNTVEPSLVQKQYETKTDAQGPVTVEVTPQIFPEDRQWKFEMVLDTHSVELDQDPLQVVVLIDDQGNTFKPISWDGPGPGGHHREGILIFEAIIPVPKYIELKIQNVGNIPERSLKWNIQ